jgi:hypothetical protein
MCLDPAIAVRDVATTALHRSLTRLLALIAVSNGETVRGRAHGAER